MASPTSSSTSALVDYYTRYGTPCKIPLEIVQEIEQQKKKYSDTADFCYDQGRKMLELVEVVTTQSTTIQDQERRIDRLEHRCPVMSILRRIDQAVGVFF